jgi:hypothetical protein
MGRAASVAVAAKWRDRIDRWRRSTWSIGEFCRRERVSQASFYQWRKRLKAAATRRPRPRRAGGLVARPGFVQLPQPEWPVTAALRILLSLERTVSSGFPRSRCVEVWDFGQPKSAGIDWMFPATRGNCLLLPPRRRVPMVGTGRGGRAPGRRQHHVHQVDAASAGVESDRRTC